MLTLNCPSAAATARRPTSVSVLACAFSACLALLAPMVSGQSPPDGSVRVGTKISSTSGGFTGSLAFGDLFGLGLTAIGDLDGDGRSELAVGAPGDDDGEPDSDRGGVWILYLNDDGSVNRHAKISHTDGDLGHSLQDESWFGYGVERLGDFDGDGVFDLAVGAAGDPDGGPFHGAVWLLMLTPEGSVKSSAKISELSGGLGASLDLLDDFGNSLANLGDIDGDGVVDLAVSAVFDDDGAFNAGAVYVLRLNADGSVKDRTKISNTSGNLGPVLKTNNEFGRSLASLGDVDGDGVPDLAVGAFGDHDGALLAGAVWILFLNPDGSVKDKAKISALSGGFTGTLGPGARFGSAVAGLGDLNGDGLPDLAVGASRGPFYSPGASRVFVLFLNADGSVKSQVEIGNNLGGFPNLLDDGDKFGEAIANLGDIDGDGVIDLAVGAAGDDDGGADRGAVYVLMLNGKAGAAWSTVLPGLPGSVGTPRLAVDATLQPGSAGLLRVLSGPPLAPAWLIMGAAYLGGTGFKGGTFHPHPQLVVPVTLNSHGALELAFVWPTDVPAGIPFWVQAWVTDAGTAWGFSASAGLAGLTQ